ncbi:PAS domain-containing protein [Yunchengibacter salinarum]|uniref:PAS domain-containing protein n=1 Tax=Yunchengibacter salinarum TaxID=3133399 RepID=UPI0035B5C15C
MDAMGRDESARLVVQHWSRLVRQPAEPAPRKRAFSPGQVRLGLPDVFILQRHTPDRIKLRLAGTRLTLFLSQDMTGMDLLSHVPPQSLDAEKGFYNALCDYPCGGIKWRMVSTNVDEPFVFRAVYLPLTDACGRVNYLVGSGAMLSLRHFRNLPGNPESGSNDILGNMFVDLGHGIPGPDHASADTVRDVDQLTWDTGLPPQEGIAERYATC